MPMATSPEKNIQIAHGISTVPVPRTGTMSITAVISAIAKI